MRAYNHTCGLWISASVNQFMVASTLYWVLFYHLINIQVGQGKTLLTVWTKQSEVTSTVGRTTQTLSCKWLISFFPLRIDYDFDLIALLFGQVLTDLSFRLHFQRNGWLAYFLNV